MGAAVAITAAGPVSLVAAALLGLAAGIKNQEHRDAAHRVQQSLVENMQAKNVPVQCPVLSPRVASACLRKSFGMTLG